MSDAALLTPKDFQTSQEIRWCPGCGDYSILKQVQTVLPDMGIPKEDIVFISGIGCSSRFPYYMNTYGMHSIHGRATAIASGLKVSRPELSVWVITGDGDSLSIGGNHLIHLLRRNIDVQILLFNNEIYGLTKGQYSPTSAPGKVAKSTPYGSIDNPFRPIALALGADASFIARTLDRDPKHVQCILKRAHKHRGTSFVEIYQNCNIFNDGAFQQFTNKATKAASTVFLEHGKPLIYGENMERGIRLDGAWPVSVSLDEYSPDDLFVHDETDAIKADIMAHMADHMHTNLPRPFGVFYAKERPAYEKRFHQQLQEQISRNGTGNLDDLLQGPQTWTVG